LEHGLTTVNIADAHTCAATAMALTVAQMLGASVFVLDSGAARNLCIKLFSGCGWIIATALQLLLSTACVAGSSERCIALALATALTLFETLAGYFAIDGLIVPGSLALACAVRHWLDRTRRKR
jgi:hypothetical protein